MLKQGEVKGVKELCGSTLHRFISIIGVKW